MKLSILIPTLQEESHFLEELIININSQMGSNKDHVQVLTDARDRSVKTGTKRNDLLDESLGEYVWFVDTDDYIYPYAIQEILSRIVLKPDVIGINGIMTTDGLNEVGWEIRLGHPYQKVTRQGKEFYLRHPNHITPMRREHAIKARFPDVTFAEDYQFAIRLKEMDLLKTEEIIQRPIYHYRFRTNKHVQSK